MENFIPGDPVEHGGDAGIRDVTGRRPVELGRFFLVGNIIQQDLTHVVGVTDHTAAPPGAGSPLIAAKAGISAEQHDELSQHIQMVHFYLGDAEDGYSQFRAAGGQDPMLVFIAHDSGHLAFGAGQRLGEAARRLDIGPRDFQRRIGRGISDRKSLGRGLLVLHGRFPP